MHTHIHTHGTTQKVEKHTDPLSQPWRPSLDKRKTALSWAAAQLFSVVKHVYVWQSKLLFQLAVADTDRAFKIWEKPRAAALDAARDTVIYPQCIGPCLLTEDFINAVNAMFLLTDTTDGEFADFGKI